MPIFPLDDGELPGAPSMSGGASAQLPIRVKAEIEERNPRLEVKRVDDISGRSPTPPVRIASPSPARLDILRKAQNEPAEEQKLDFEEVMKRAAKKRQSLGMQPGAPAMHTVRGFQTPVASGDEDGFSGASTPRLRPKEFDSITNSPSLRPATPSSGISALKLQLEKLDTGMKSPRLGGHAMRREFSNTGSEAGQSEGGKSDMDTYEVPLENEFVSPEVSEPPKPLFGAIEGGLRQNSMHRKMTAADFEPITCLGKGAFGTVLLVKQRGTGRLYAQKQFKKASLVVHKRTVEQTKTERNILESVNRHPFVVKLFYAFQDHEKLYLILEYAQGGELFHHLAMERMFTEETASFYMAEIVLALEHLHKNLGVIYRDLKPENCLLDVEGHLLLTDFGLSKVAVDGEGANSFLGTVDYMAPEIVAGHEYGFAVDWWSLGALGHDLLTGSPPFAGANNKKIQEKILNGKLKLPFFLGPDAKDLLIRLLRKDPKKRLGSNMVKDIPIIKSHRFFKKIDWSKLKKRELDPPIKPLITDPELAENFSAEFTGLSMSPVVSKRSTAEHLDDFGPEPVSANPFGGFSFVASQSLLDTGAWAV
jgi:serine/threonine protein kinase